MVAKGRGILLLGDRAARTKGQENDAVAHTLPPLPHPPRPASPSCPPKITPTSADRAVLGNLISLASQCEEGATLFPNYRWGDLRLSSEVTYTLAKKRQVGI